MHRSFVAAGVAIAGLGAAGVAVIAVVSREPARRPAPPPTIEAPAREARPPPGAAPPAAAGVTELVASASPSSRPAPLPQPSPADAPPPLPPPPAASWEAVEPAGRPSELGAIGPGFMMALRNEVSGTLARCFDEDTEARHASSGATPTWVSDGNTTALGAPPVLMLELETAAGAVTVVDAPLEAQGSAGDGTILCAQRALRGLTLGVPAAQAGERHRLRYPLTR